jgi:glycosyltransferase involved in cell wall biosynthesis
MRANFGSARYFFGALAFFPKAVHFGRSMALDGVQHVHAHFASHPAAAAFVIHRLTRIPYSFTAHGSDLHRDRHMLSEKVEEAAFVATISNFNRELIVRECGEAFAEKVKVIRCGVNTDFFRPPAAGRSLRPGAPFRIFCVGTLHEVKGQAYLIEACAKLAARGLKFSCEFVGEGPDASKLRKLAAEAGIADRVVFHGAQSRHQLVQLLHQADVVVAPSVPTANGRREGIPVSLMEAAACGLPLVASRITGVPELVEDGVVGFLVEPRDSTELAAALERLAGDSPLRRRFGAEARFKVLREFDLALNAEVLADSFPGGGRAW